MRMDFAPRTVEETYLHVPGLAFSFRGWWKGAGVVGTEHRSVVAEG